MLHSRQALSNIQSKEEASYQGLLWVIESMHYHHLNRVIFASDDDLFTKVILRPKAWPNYRCQQVQLMERLCKLELWRVIKEDREINKGVFFIAQSVIRQVLSSRI